MKWTSLLLVVAACSAGDDTTDGARGLCAVGGAINQCPPADPTPQGACWRMVDCAAIPLHSMDDSVFDWDHCVNTIEGMTTTAEQLTIECIVASSCDQLKTGDNHAPHRQDFSCLLLGGGGN